MAAMPNLGFFAQPGVQGRRAARLRVTLAASADGDGGGEHTHGDAEAVLRAARNGAQLAGDVERGAGGLTAAWLVDFLRRAVEAGEAAALPAPPASDAAAGSAGAAYDWEALVDVVVSALGHLAMQQSERRAQAHGAASDNLPAGPGLPRAGASYAYAGSLHSERVPRTAAGGRHNRALVDARAIQAVAATLSHFMACRPIVLSACWTLEALLAGSSDARRVFLTDPACAGRPAAAVGAPASTPPSAAAHAASSASAEAPAAAAGGGAHPPLVVRRGSGRASAHPAAATRDDGSKQQQRTAPPVNGLDLLLAVQLAYGGGAAHHGACGCLCPLAIRPGESLVWPARQPPGAVAPVSEMGATDSPDDSDGVPRRGADGYGAAPEDGISDDDDGSGGRATTPASHPPRPPPDAAILAATAVIHQQAAMLAVPLACDGCVRVCVTGAGGPSRYIAWLAARRGARSTGAWWRWWRCAAHGSGSGRDTAIVPHELLATSAAAAAAAGLPGETTGAGKGGAHRQGGADGERIAAAGSGAKPYAGRRRGSLSGATAGRRFIVFGGTRAAAREVVVRPG